VIILDKIPPTLLQKTKEYLEKLKLGKTSNYTAARFKKLQGFVGEAILLFVMLTFVVSDYKGLFFVIALL